MGIKEAQVTVYIDEDTCQQYNSHYEAQVAITKRKLDKMIVEHMSYMEKNHMSTGGTEYLHSSEQVIDCLMRQADEVIGILTEMREVLKK